MTQQKKGGNSTALLEQRVELPVNNRQRVDLGKSINVLSTTRPANNPFVKPSNGNGSKPATSNVSGGSSPATKK